MNFEPLLASAWHIQVHAFAALAALVLGAVQFLAPKGTLPHRVLGPIWVALMALVVLTAAFIVRIPAPGASFLTHFTIIHYIFIPLTTLGLVGGVVRILAGGPKFKRHAGPFLGLFIGGLVIAGFFTFTPGRIMYDVLFGTRISDNPYSYRTPYLYFLPGAQPPPKRPRPAQQ